MEHISVRHVKAYLDSLDRIGELDELKATVREWKVEAHESYWVDGSKKEWMGGMGYLEGGAKQT